jgi:hypothetical protein
MTDEQIKDHYANEKQSKNFSNNFGPVTGTNREKQTIADTTEMYPSPRSMATTAMG